MYNSHDSTALQYLEPLDHSSGSKTILCGQGFSAEVISTEVKFQHVFKRLIFEIFITLLNSDSKFVLKSK